MGDNSRNIAVRMTDVQFQQLQRYMKLTPLNSTNYFRKLIIEDPFKGRSRELNRALHASLNKIYSNIQQITRHQRTKELDARAVAQILFLTDKLCEEVYLLAAQK